MGNSNTRRRAKRANNTGSYWFATAEGRWRATFLDADGEPRYLSAPLEQEVVAILDQAVAERDRGVLGLAPNQTPSIGDWMDMWLASKFELKPKTVQRYRLDIDLYIKPHIGSLRIDQLKAPTISALYGRLLNEVCLSPSSVKHVHSTLSAALGQAFDFDVVKIPVMTKVKAPKVPLIERQILDDDTIRRFLEEAKTRDHRTYVRWRLALLWGPRQGEVLGLRWSDVDLKTGTILIRQQMQYFSGEGMKVGTPKAAASVRRFVVDGETLSALKTLRKEMTAAQIASKNWTDQDLIFSTENGGPIDTSNDRRQFKRLLAAISGGDFRVHDARHTAITNMVMDGTPLATIQKVVGHSDIRTTISYVHLAEEAYESAAVAVGRRYA